MAAGVVERRLRIALLVDRFGNRFGGAESYGVELVRVLAQRHEISIVARDYDCDLALTYLPVKVSCRLPSWLRVLYFAWRAHRLTRGRFDIVHSHMNGWAGQVQVMHVTPVRYNHLNSAGWLKRLRVWTSPRLATYLLLEKARVRAAPARRMVAVSHLIAEQVHASYGATLTVTTILPGVRVPVAVVAERRRATRIALGWNADTIGCLLVARNPLRKGLPTLLSALDQLPPVYRLLVVGADQAANDLLRGVPSLQGRIHFVAPTPDVAPYFEAADIYAHPTLNDSFGMAPLEAMSYGVPVIISGPIYCGFAQYLRHEQDALILNDPCDRQELARALSRLGSDTSLREQLARNGLNMARLYSWEAVAARYEALYEELLQER
jgi:UDP-glucose:(heptosyl)LPS alpha-1,3-glucosyltransferase